MGLEEQGRALDAYTRVIDQLARSRDFSHAVSALRLIPSVVKEMLEEQAGVLNSSSIKERVEDLGKELRVIRGELDKFDGKLENLGINYEELADKISDIDEKMSELNKRLSHVEMYVGGLAEAFLARAFIDGLVSESYVVLSKSRNHVIDGEGIDLVVVAKKEGGEKHFVVEVKVRPKRSDVGALLAKAELYAAKTGVEPVPVLAGTWIGVEVKSYARSKGVVVIDL